MMNFLLFVLNCFAHAIGSAVGDVNQTEAESIMVIHACVGTLLGLVILCIPVIKYRIHQGEWNYGLPEKKTIALVAVVMLLYFYAAYLFQGRYLVGM